MRTWHVKELADPDKALHLVEVEKPVVEKGNVLIKVEGAALNFFDILLCQGKYQEEPPLPFTPGAEVSGVIEGVAEGSKFKVGDRVLAQPPLPNGGLAEYVTAPENKVYVISDSMTFNDAAALFITYQTSYYALHGRANIQAGEVLLVHAGAGGVGSAAIQLGKAAGARVIATAGGPEKTQVCRDLGADVVIDYLTEDFKDIVNKETDGKGADIIYDPVGGDTFDKSRRCIAFDGRILSIGFAGGRIPEAPVNHALIKNYSIVGVHWGYFARVNPQGPVDIHEALMKLYDEKKIKPLVFQEYPFEEVPKALDMLGSRKTWGKLIIKP